MSLFIEREKKYKLLCINCEFHLSSRHNLIAHDMNHIKKRWKYRDVGEALLTNFPSIPLEQSPKFKTKYVSKNGILILM